MISWDLLKESFTKALPNTILLMIAFAVLNGKLNKILIKEGIYDTKIEQLNSTLTECKNANKSMNYRISKLEQNCAAHFGEAYIKEEDDDGL